MSKKINIVHAKMRTVYLGQQVATRVHVARTDKVGSLKGNFAWKLVSKKYLKGPNSSRQP